MSRGPRMDLHEWLVLATIKELNKEPATLVRKNTTVGDIWKRIYIIGSGRAGLRRDDTEDEGVADIIGIGPGGLYLEFEAKSGKARTPNSALSKEQRRHRDDVLAFGGFYTAFGEPSEAVGLYRKWLQQRSKA